MKTKMKTTSLLLLFPLLLFLVAHADDQGKDSDLKCSPRTEAELGKDVTLDCYCEPPCDVTVGEELKWKFNQKTTVLLYIGTYDTLYQDDQFKGRAHVTSTERLKDGNIPVTISTFRSHDEGTYTCHVGSKTCSVELKVFSLKCPEETIKAQVGQNVTLNCKSEPQRDLMEKRINWKFKENITVLSFRDRITPARDEHFKGRIHPVSGWKVSEGKLSVEISSVDESDAGVYTCSVLYGSTCTVTLIVNGKSTETSGAREENTTPTSGGINIGARIGIGAVAGVLVLIAVNAALVTWKFHEKCRKQKKTGPPQDDQEDHEEDVPLQEV